MGAALTGEVAERLIKEYLAAPITGVTFLPSERELTQRLSVSRTTVRRALQALESDGWIRAEQGRGYRRLVRFQGLGSGSRIAMLRPEEHQGISDELAHALQVLALQRGAQLLSLGTRQDPKAVVADLKSAGVWGTIVTLDDFALHQALADAELPCILVDCAGRHGPLDSIKQDNYGGALMAAEHLLDKGHTRMAWFGPVRASAHSLERFAGATAALTARGLAFEPGLVPDLRRDALIEAKALLSSSQRPTAVLAMWSGHAQALARAAMELGLKINRDLDVVGWADNHQYASQFSLLFAATGPFPVITWSIDDLARVAIERLAIRQKDPKSLPLMLTLPCHLRNG
ncbi:MAG: GntR family transcriptional regulator [Planctomycetota bacterium]|nr:GntR family transcriptional regulator [Planctomycetota bacterium]